MLARPFLISFFSSEVFRVSTWCEDFRLELHHRLVVHSEESMVMTHHLRTMHQAILILGRNLTFSILEQHAKAKVGT